MRKDSVKAVEITGYKKSGKTTLVASLAQELNRRRKHLSFALHRQAKC